MPWTKDPVLSFSSWHSRLLLGVMSGLLYFAAAKGALLFIIEPEMISTFWPPIGLLLGLLILTDHRTWAFILAGAFVANAFANLQAGKEAETAIGYACADTLGPLLGAFVLRVWMGPTLSLKRVRDIVALLAAGALVSSATASTLGALVTSWTIEGVQFGAVWPVWWTADVVGILVFTPLLISWIEPEYEAFSWNARKWMEGALMGLVLWFGSHWIFSQTAGPSAASVSLLPFLVFPVMIWAGLRFGPSGASLACLVLAFEAVYETSSGNGPFASMGSNASEQALRVQVFLTVIVLSALVVAAAFSERQASERASRSSEQRLRSLFENAAIGFYRTTPAGEILWANPCLVRMLGFNSLEELQERRVDDSWFLTDKKRGQFLDAVETSGSVEGWEDIWIRKDGTPIYMRESSIAVRDDRNQTKYYEGHVEDVTDRHKAMLELAESEHRYRQAIEVVGAVPYFQLYEPERFEFVGKRIKELTGIEPELFTPEALDELILETVPIEHLEGLPLDQAIERSKHGEGVSWRADYRIMDRSGHERWLANAAIQVRDDSGKLIGSLGILQDITDRKKAQEAIQASERLYRQAIEGVEAVPYYTDFATDAYTFLGNGIEALTGYPTDEFTPDIFRASILNRVHRGDLVGLESEEAVAKMQSDPGMMWSADYHIRRKDGAERWISDTAVQIRDDTGKVIGDLGIIQDITERKSIEEELKRQRREQQVIFDSVPALIWYQDREGTIRRANRAVSDKLGIPPDLVDGTLVRDIYAENSEKYFHEERTILETGFPQYGIQKELLAKGGEHRNFLMDKIPHHDDHGNIIGLIIFALDVTDRLRVEEERRALEAQIHHAQKLESLGVLAGGIAHDFNNLLMGVLGNASLALEELGVESPAYTSIQHIEVAALRAAELAKQMLAYSGRGKFIVQRINLTKLVEEMSHLLEVSISKKVILRYDFTTPLPAIEADATQIRQVVMNLITNASDAIGDRSGVITIATGVIEVDTEYLSETYLDDNLPGGYYVYVEVTDTGEGMDEETRSKIFDPFFTTKFTGRGLGLAAVLGIVRGHKGAIKVYSQAGRGSTFKVLVPCSDDPESEAWSEPNRKVTGWKGSGTVLVVDDEETVRAVSKRMLEAHGFEVITASDGRQGVEVYLANQAKVRLVLLDMTMPRMDGEEAFRELRRIDPSVCVLLTSGYNEQEATHRFLGKGLAGFIQKPFTPQTLLSKVRETLEPEV